MMDACMSDAMMKILRDGTNHLGFPFVILPVKFVQIWLNHCDHRWLQWPNGHSSSTTTAIHTHRSFLKYYLIVTNVLLFIHSNIISCLNGWWMWPTPPMHSAQSQVSWNRFRCRANHLFSGAIFKMSLNTQQTHSFQIFCRIYFPFISQRNRP